MNSPHLLLRFDIDPGDAFGTLESVLAIARRGGLALERMATQVQGRQHQVQLGLGAADPDLLHLFLARLGNQIGVSAIDIEAIGAGTPALHA